VGALFIRFAVNGGAPVLAAVVGGLLVVGAAAVGALGTWSHRSRVTLLLGGGPIGMAPVLRAISMLERLTAVAFVAAVAMLG
jgi:hypothetical protein